MVNASNTGYDYYMRWDRADTPAAAEHTAPFLRLYFPAPTVRPLLVTGQ